MNKEDPYRDQAERLRKRIEKINDSNEKQGMLPPRGDLHRNVRKKTKWKLKFPMIRLLLIMFILLLITIYSVYSYLGVNKFSDLKKTPSHVSGYETVNIEGNSETKKEALVDKDLGKSGLEKNNEPSQHTSAKGTSSTNLINSSYSETKGPETDKNGSGDVPKISEKKDHSSLLTENQYKYHTVGHQETLYHIAMTYYHSPEGIEWIKNANKIKEDGIKEGQVLKIPLKK